MRITGFRIEGAAGIGLVQVHDLSDIVVLAGPNGVGKTRIVSSLIEFLRKPNASKAIQVQIEATSDLERELWQKDRLDTAQAQDTQLLRTVIHRNQRRNNYASTVLNFDSNRAISQVQPYAFSWDVVDPFEEEQGWDTSFGFLRDRFQDLQHSLFRLVESQRRKISENAIALQKSGQRVMELDFPDPLIKFKEAFGSLLGPKRLEDLDVKDQRIHYSQDGERRELSTLSSGEREVVNIVFDFILRNPSDCVVFFDEPELHLHPELSYRLLRTLATIGSNNQFIFCTHSPEIITASIENSVIFVRPKSAATANQAIPVSRDDATHHALNLLGQSVGIVSLGKKLLLIEGEEASLDKQTYGAILGDEFPELVMVPVGGRRTISAFEEVQSAVLNRTIWGVEFFMLCDRDAEYDIGPKSLQSRIGTRLQILPRYHLENYFLDPITLAAVFSEMERDPGSWLRSPDAIAEQLSDCARTVVPYATSLKVSAQIRESIGNVDIKPRSIGTTLEQLIESARQRFPLEQARIADGLDIDAAIALIKQEYSALTDSIDAGTDFWKINIPGRVVLNKFAGKASIGTGRLKTLYLAKARGATQDPFSEIRALFRTMRSSASTAAVQ